MRARHIPAITSMAAQAAELPPPAWPPTAPNMLYLHPGIAYTGDATDVQSITFANGLPMVIAGDGDPVSIDADGLHFNRGKYLEYIPPAASTYDGLAVFGRLTTTAESTNSTAQKPINLLDGTASFLVIKRRFREIESDISGASVNVRGVSDLTSNVPMVVGVHFDARLREYGGSYASWLNSHIAGASDDATSITPTAWRIGEDFWGTIHEGVVFFRTADDPGDLLPPGGNAEWMAGCLAQAGAV